MRVTVDRIDRYIEQRFGRLSLGLTRSQSSRPAQEEARFELGHRDPRVTSRTTSKRENGSEMNTSVSKQLYGIQTD